MTSESKICTDCEQPKLLTNFPKYDSEHRVSFCRKCKRKREASAKAALDPPIIPLVGRSVPSIHLGDISDLRSVPQILGRMMEMLSLLKDESQDKERIDYVYDSILRDFSHVVKVTRSSPPIDAYQKSDRSSTE